jgi:phosphate transport system substrate-binding protein
MRTRYGLWLWTLLVFFSAGCSSEPGKAKDVPDKNNSGTIHISCDESFKPVIDEEVRVYEAQYPDAHIIVHYKPEQECLKDFGVDSIKMIFATRGFSEQERRWMTDSLNVAPQQLVIAHDLVAVIVNPDSEDTVFSMRDIKAVVGGKSKKNLIPVFDGTKATSTVRFMLDSVLKGEPLGKNVVAAQSSAEVVDYVSKTENAIGFVGYSWIGNADDTSQASYRKKVKTAWMETTDSAGAYVKPSQYFIYTKSYPMVRDLVYTVKEQPAGVAHGFAKFLETMRGQLIFKRSYIMPVIFPNYVRDARLTEDKLINK